MSRTIKFTKVGGPDVLEFIETAVPTPGPAEARIKVRAIGINRAEAVLKLYGSEYAATAVPRCGRRGYSQC
jgi:NADPH:quinone reductase-like Zn-dependent oxidoreductase